VYLPRTSGISTTELKQVLQSLEKEKLEAARHALEHATKLLKELVTKP
jgi:hypothetical protein